MDRYDILFSMIGDVGTIYRIDEDNIDFAIKNVALYKTSQNIAFGSYLYITLKSVLMDAYIYKVMSGSIQKFIGLRTLREMPIAYKDEFIDRYYENTKCLFRKMTEIKKENKELISLRDFLLPLLMNGQVRFKEVALAEDV